MLSNLMTSDKKTTEESVEIPEKSKKRKKQRQIQIFFYLVML